MFSRNTMGLLGLLIAAMLGLVLVTPAQAVTYTWNGTGAAWDVAGDWNPAGGPPGLLDTATFNDTGTATTAVDLGTSGDKSIDTLILSAMSANYSIGSTAGSILTIVTKVTQNGANSSITAKVATGTNDLTFETLAG